MFAAGMLHGAIAMAQSPASIAKTRENLLVVIRESSGANRQDDTLRRVPPVRARLADGREVEVELAHYDYLGDTQIRFVFDSPRVMANATLADLATLGLDTTAAIDLAIANIRRVYGEPAVKPWKGTVMRAQGRSPDLHSSHLLDRAFWRRLLERNPDGLVAGVPSRGSLLFAAVTDAEAVADLRREVPRLHAAAGTLRVSSALFLFKGDRWSVFQAPAQPGRDDPAAGRGAR